MTRSLCRRRGGCKSRLMKLWERHRPGASSLSDVGTIRPTGCLPDPRGCRRAR